MKKFKFRSWNEERKQFFYFQNGEHGDRLEGDDIVIYEDGIFFFDWQNAEQSTGLLDKNGKEIYVGDKVKWKDYDHFGSCFEYESVVEQEKGGAFITETPDGTGSYYVWGKTDNLEVVGHIHKLSEKDSRESRELREAIKSHNELKGLCKTLARRFNRGR